MSCRHLHPTGKAFFAAFLFAAVVSCNRQPVQDSASSISNTATPITPAAKEISFGRRQIDQMLADRPDMAGLLNDDDSILLWVIDSMNGSRLGQRIYWNGSSPIGGALAEHWRPAMGYPPHIRLTDGVNSGIDKWTELVFELFNLDNDRSFDTLDEEAYAGAIHGDAYATEYARLEYVALVKTNEFFEKHPFPGAEPGDNPEYDWIAKIPSTFEEYMASSTDEKGAFRHPGDTYKKRYDTSIAPYVVPERKYKRKK